MRFIRSLSIGILMVLLLSVFAPAYATAAVPSISVGMSDVSTKVASVGDYITLAGKLKITKNGSSYTAILTLDTPETFIVNRRTYSNCKDIQVFVPNRLDGKAVRVTGTLKAAGNNTSVYKRKYVLENASAVAIPAATSVFLNRTSAVIQTNGALQLSALVKPSGAKQNVTWSSSNAKVATVDSNGLVVGKTKGTATITAKTANGKKATCKVTVNVPVSGVKLSAKNAKVTEGKLYQLTATVSPSNAYQKSVAWTSSNTSVATVSSNGLVTAISAGTARITVTTTGLGPTKTASCTIEVTGAPVLTSLNLDMNSMYLKVGQSLKVPVVVTPVNAKRPTITYTSLDPKVVSITNGDIMTGKKAGVARIKVSYSGTSFTKLCCVTSKAVPNVKLSASDLYVYMGKTLLKFPMTLSDVKKLCPGGKGTPNGTEIIYNFNDSNSNSVFKNPPPKDPTKPIDPKKQTFISFETYDSAAKTFRGITVGDNVNKLLAAYGRSGLVEDRANGRFWHSTVKVGKVNYTIEMELSTSSNKILSIELYRQ